MKKEICDNCKWWAEEFQYWGFGGYPPKPNKRNGMGFTPPRGRCSYFAPPEFYDSNEICENKKDCTHFWEIATRPQPGGGNSVGLF